MPGIAPGTVCEYLCDYGARGFSLAHAPALLRQSLLPDGDDAVGAVACGEGLPRHGFNRGGIPLHPGQF